MAESKEKTGWRLFLDWRTIFNIASGLVLFGIIAFSIYRKNKVAHESREEIEDIVSNIVVNEKLPSKANGFEKVSYTIFLEGNQNEFIIGRVNVLNPDYTQEQLINSIKIGQKYRFEIYEELDGKLHISSAFPLQKSGSINTFKHDQKFYIKPEARYATHTEGLVARDSSVAGLPKGGR